MKKITYLLIVLIFLATKIQAQAPQTMSYQAVMRNSSNALLANTALGMKISILQGSATGTAAYAETQTATTNSNGLVSLQIGNGTATTGTFAGIDWSTGSYFIKTETDPTGGSNYTITGTQKMMSVPYALYAKNGITTAQANAIVAMQAQMDAQATTNSVQAATIAAMQAQITYLLPKPTVTVTVDSYTYNGFTQGPTIATNTGTGASYTFSYVGTGATTYAASSTRPTNAGTYTVTATVATNGNFGQASSSATAFTIVGAIFTIGLHPELGGYVFQISEDGLHGLVSETQNQGLVDWDGAQSLISNSINHSVDGQQFTDWRLPTLNELTQIYTNRIAIGGFTGVGSLPYWSSTPGFYGYSFYSITGGYSGYDDSFRQYKIRAVRSF